MTFDLPVERVVSGLYLAYNSPA